MAPRAAPKREGAQEDAIAGNSLNFPLSADKELGLVQLLRTGKESSVIAAAGALEKLAFGDEQRLLLADAGAIPPLVQLLRDGSPSVKDAATKAIGALANAEGCRGRLEDAGAVPLLVRWLETGPSHLSKCVCAIALRNLAVSTGLQSSVAKAGAVAPLVALLSSADLDSKVASAGALMNLAANDALRASVISAGAIPPLVRLLQSEDVPQEGKLDAEQALCNLVLDSNANKDMTRDDTIARVLIDLVRSGSSKGRELASLALEDIALFQESNRAVIASLGGIPPLVALVGSGSRMPDPARRAGAKALAAVAVSRPNRALVAQAQGIEALAGFLIEGPVRENRVAAAEALGSVCTKDKGNQDAFLAFRGSMDALSDMLSPPGVAGQGAGAGGKDKGKGKDKAPAAKAGKDALESAESMREIVLTPEAIEAHEDMRRSAAMLVAALGEANGPAQEQMCKVGLGPRLVDTVVSGSPASKRAAALALRVLAAYPTNQRTLAADGAVAPLVALLAADDSATIEVAAAALGALADRNLEANQTAVAEAGAVPHLVRALGNHTDVSARIEVANTLKNLCSGHRANQNLIAAEEQAMPGIVRLLQLGREVEQAIALHAQEVAGSAIRDLVSDNHHNMALAAKADGIEPLVDILIQGSERGKEIAANALVNLAGVTESVRRIINAGAIEPMVTMLQSPFTNDEGRRAAAGALGYLATNSKATQILISVIGAIGPLVALVKTGNHESRTAAALALANLAKGHWPIQRDIAEAGGVESLVILLGGEVVDPTKADEAEPPPPPPAAGGKGKGAAAAGPDYSKVPWKCREAAARALESVADAYKDVQSHAAAIGCIPPLVDLLRHEANSAREWAARALAVLAQLPANVRVITEVHGAAGPLMDACRSADEGCREAACLAVHNIAVSGDGARGLMIDAGVLEPLAAVLRDAKLEGKVQASRAVTVLCQTSESKARVVAAGGLEGLVRQLQEAEGRVDATTAAARCITQLAAGELQVQAAVAKSGALPILVNLLGSKVQEVRDASAIALWALTGHPLAKRTLYETGAMERLVKVVTQSAAALLKPAAPRQAEPDASESDGEREVLDAVRGLVDLLCQGTDGGKKDAAWGLVNISKTGPNRKAVAKAGAVPLLVNLLVYGSRRAQAAAMWALWRLTCGEATRALVADKQYVTIINKVLASGNASARIAACGTLADIAEGVPRCLPLVVEAGCLGNLTRQLTDPVEAEPTGKNRIPELSALELPGVWAEVAERMREARAGERLAAAALAGRRRASLVHTARRVQSELEEESGRPKGEDPVKDSATWSLWRIHETEKAGQQGREVLDAILSSDAVPAAVQMLTRGSYYGRHGAAGLLGSIAERGKDVQQVIESHGALEGLIDILADSNTPQVVLQQAARSLGSICWRLPALFRKVAQLGVMQKVVDVLPRAAQATKEPMLWLLWQTAAADGRHCATLLDLPGAVAKVVAVLRERPEKGGDVALWRAKRCACGLLGLIAYQSRAAQQRLAENDCLLPLMSVVTYPFGEPQIPPPKPKKRPAAEAAPAPDAPPAGKGKGKDAKGGKGAKQQPQPEPEPEPETESEPDPMPVMMDDVAARPDWVRCVEEACSALKNLLYENRELQESMLARDGVAVAMRAMRMDDEGVSAAACNLMRIMCRAPALQARFLEDPGILKTMLLLEDFKFAVEFTVVAAPAAPAGKRTSMDAAPGEAAAAGRRSAVEDPRRASAPGEPTRPGGHRLAAATRNENWRMSEPVAPSAAQAPERAREPEERVMVWLKPVPRGERLMQAVASVLAELSKGIEHIQNFMAANHVIRVLVDVLRSPDVLEPVKMSCMGALVNIGHKNFKAQQVIHESNAISILVDLLGPPEGYLGRETRDSALSTAPSGVDGSVTELLPHEQLTAADVAKSAAWCLMNLADYHIHLDVVAKELIRSGHIPSAAVMFKFLKSVTMKNRRISSDEED